MKNRITIFAALVLLAGSSLWAQLPSTKTGEWPYYTADLKGTKYSPLDQVSAANFNQLEVAWIASDLGRQQGLGSGRAVLVRRQVP